MMREVVNHSPLNHCVGSRSARWTFPAMKCLQSSRRAEEKGMWRNGFCISYSATDQVHQLCIVQGCLLVVLPEIEDNI